MDNDPPKTVHELLHRLWTKAVGTPNYFKGDWRLLEMVLRRGLNAQAELRSGDVKALWVP